MPEVFLFIMFFVVTFMALLEGGRAWGARGALSVAGVQFGLLGGLYVLAANRMAIPFGLAIPVVTGFVLFRRAQTAKLARIASMDDGDGETF